MMVTINFKIFQENKFNLAKSIYENFLLYFFSSFFLGLLFWYGSGFNLTYVWCNLFIFLIIFAFKENFDFKIFRKGPLFSISTSFNVISLVISSFVILYVNTIYSSLQSEYTWNTSYTLHNIFVLYWLTFILTALFIFRNYEIKFGKNTLKFFKRIAILTKSIIVSSKDKIISFTRAILIFPVVLDYMTVRKLSKDPKAVYFAKKFIIIQSNSMKNILPGTDPSTISNAVRVLFKSDLDRMYQLLKINHIKFHSKRAILIFLMKIADPIITDLQITLEQHLTEELLKESNNSKNLNINVDVLWKKIEKTLVNWESTFSDNELQYKDSLLHK